MTTLTICIGRIITEENYESSTSEFQVKLSATPGKFFFFFIAKILILLFLLSKMDF